MDLYNKWSLKIRISVCFLNDERDLLSLVFCESAPHNSGPLQIKLVVVICMLRATARGSLRHLVQWS